MRMKHRSPLVAATALAAVLLLPGAATLAEDDDHGMDVDDHGVWTLVIEQAPPTLVTLPAGDTAGPSMGDIMAFEAAATADDGRTGTIRGLLITVGIPDGTDVLEDRIGQIIFDLGDGDSLVVIGASVYAAGEAEMDPEAAQLRAVVGGTGIYIGARGEVSTVRHADGSYTHTVTLLHEGVELHEEVD